MKYQGYEASNNECIIVNRATNSFALYQQMIGRSLRKPIRNGLLTRKEVIKYCKPIIIGIISYFITFITTYLLL